MSTERLAAVQRVFRDVFDDDALTITPETTPADVEGWDSVAQVKILLSLEEEFGFRFKTEEVSKVRSVADLLAAMASHR